METEYTVARTEDGIRQIGRFLDIDPAGFGPPQTDKRNTNDILSRFSNPERARSFLEENELQHWASEN
jgi:hypothetical protein